MNMRLALIAFVQGFSRNGEQMHMRAIYEGWISKPIAGTSAKYLRAVNEDSTSKGEDNDDRN